MQKYKGGIFLTVKDLMALNGSINYESTRRQHQAIRDCIRPHKRKLTIREYCEFEGVDFEEVASFLSFKYL